MIAGVMVAEEAHNPLLPATYDIVWSIAAAVVLIAVVLVVVVLVRAVLRRDRAPESCACAGAHHVPDTHPASVGAALHQPDGRGGPSQDR